MQHGDPDHSLVMLHAFRHALEMSQYEYSATVTVINYIERHIDELVRGDKRTIVDKLDDAERNQENLGHAYGRWRHLRDRLFESLAARETVQQ